MNYFRKTNTLSLHCFTVLLLIAPNPGVLSADQIQLTVKSSDVEIVDSMIRIADVVDVSSANLSEAKRVGQLDLDEIQLDQTVTLTKQQILMRVRLYRLSNDAIEIRGPSKITVKRIPLGNRVSQVKSLVVTAISSQFGIPEADIQVAIDENAPSNLKLRNGVPSDSMVVLPAELPLGRTRVRIIHRDSTGQEMETDLDCRVGVMTEMLVATRNLDRGVELAEGDFRVVRRPLTQRRLVPASQRDLGGKQTARLIPVHGIIRLADLTGITRRNLVNRNDLVDVVYKIGSMTARMRDAKVLTAGGKGDRVEVLNTESNKKVVASVVSETLLEVR